MRRCVVKEGFLMKQKLGLLLVAAVAAVSIVGVASAQQGQPNPPAGGRGASIVHELVQIVSDDLGITPADLREQLQGQTLAEVIAANAGDAAIITADVTDAITERVNTALENGTLSQERADAMLSRLPEVIENALNGDYSILRGFRPGLRDSFGRGQLGERGGLFGDMLRLDALPLVNAAADATGLTAREIASQIRAGSSLSEVISANGSTPDAVLSAALETAQTRLDEAVANGRFTQQQVDDILVGVRAFYEAALNSTLHPNALNVSSGNVSFVTDAANA